MEEGGWSEPAGLHLIFMPFADDLRTAPITEAFRGTSVHSVDPAYSRFSGISYGRSQGRRENLD